MHTVAHAHARIVILSDISLSDEGASGIVGEVPLTVLVVDDDEAIVDAVANTLSADGYDVLSARDGDAALMVLGGAPRPCVVLLDLVLPRKDGWEVARSIAGLAGVMVVCMTASTHAPPDECYGTLRKPFETRALLSTVRGAFARLIA